MNQTPQPDAAQFAAQLLAAADKATLGPWAVHADHSNGQGNRETTIDSLVGEWKPCPYFCGWDEPSPSSRGKQGTANEHEHFTGLTVLAGDGWHGSGNLVVDPDDAAFIVLSRTAGPILAKAYLEAKELVGDLESALGLWLMAYDKVGSNAHMTAASFEAVMRAYRATERLQAQAALRVSAAWKGL